MSHSTFDKAAVPVWSFCSNEII